MELFALLMFQDSYGWFTIMLLVDWILGQNGSVML